MHRWLLLSLLVASQAPGGLSNLAVRDVRDVTVSSGEDAYVVWTAQTGTYAYELSFDGGPWEAVSPEEIEVVPPPGPSLRRLSVNRGTLPLGRHEVRIRECLPDRTVCAAPSGPARVTVIPPESCLMGDPGPWSEWTPWLREGDVETRSHTRHLYIVRSPGIGATHCPPAWETASESRPYVPPALDPLTVAFVRMDATTRGAWKGVYGSQGQAFAGQPSALSGVQVTPVDASVYAWATATTDARGPQRPGAFPPEDRFAAAWYAQEAFVLDVAFSDRLVHEVALYAVDWDGAGRVETIEVLDSQGTVRHRVSTGPELRTGAYYVWRISGHARIRVTRTAGANAVVFGVLIGP